MRDRGSLSMLKSPDRDYSYSYSTSSTNDRCSMKVQYIEVPVVQEVIRQVPKRQVIYTEKRIPKIEVVETEKCIDCPQMETVIKQVEVPEIHEVIRRVPKREVVDVPREVIRQVPKVETVVVEKTVEVPGEIIEVPKPVVVENKVPVSVYHDKPFPSVIAQCTRPVIVDGPVKDIQMHVIEPQTIAVDVIVPVPVPMELTMTGDCVTEHRLVDYLPPSQFNHLLKKSNPHLTQEQIKELFVRDAAGATPILPALEEHWDVVLPVESPANIPRLAEVLEMRPPPIRSQESWTSLSGSDELRTSRLRSASGNVTRSTAGNFVRSASGNVIRSPSSNFVRSASGNLTGGFAGDSKRGAISRRRNESYPTRQSTSRGHGQHKQTKPKHKSSADSSGSSKSTRAPSSPREYKYRSKGSRGDSRQRTTSNSQRLLREYPESSWSQPYNSSSWSFEGHPVSPGSYQSYSTVTRAPVVEHVITQPAPPGTVTRPIRYNSEGNLRAKVYKSQLQSGPGISPRKLPSAGVTKVISAYPAQATTGSNRQRLERIPTMPKL